MNETPVSAVPDTQPAESARSEDLDLLAVATLTLRSRRLIAQLAGGLFVLVTAIGLLFGRTYTATTSFVPQGKSLPANLSNLSGLASQFGVALPTGDVALTPPFYFELVTSGDVLRDVVLRQYQMPVAAADTLRGTLMDLYGITQGSPAARMEKAVKKLEGSLETDLSQKSGIVTVTVSADYPTLSAAIADSLIDAIKRYNTQTRQAQAAAERAFTEARLQDAAAALRSAEDDLERFMARNRDYRNSPALTFAQERLNRQVEVRQALYLSLAQSYEQSKLDEVRDTPQIAVVEHAVVPVKPDHRGLLRRGILALLLGTLLGIGLSLGREAFRGAAARGARSQREFLAAARETIHDVRHPLAFGRDIVRGWIRRGVPRT